MQYTSIAYRAHNPFWSFSPLSGDGAKLRGGRFNPKGTAALYLSLASTTALAEHNQGFPHRPQPLTLCAYDVRCDGLLDLCDESQRDCAKITLSEMSCAWELMLAEQQKPPTWQMVERLISAGYAGVLAPSYAKNAPEGAKNLILWRWNDSPERSISVIDDREQLPKNQKSWV